MIKAVDFQACLFERYNAQFAAFCSIFLCCGLCWLFTAILVPLLGVACALAANV
jgi:hypothetical protein